MPICPKCKNEYREGFTVCSDCKCDLVDFLEDIVEEISAPKEEPEAIEIVEVIEAIKEIEETADTENSEESEENTDVSIEKKERPKDGYKSGIYRNSAERAEDNKSSAWTLLSVGVIGIILLILVMAGVIPLHFYGITKYMVYGVMFALFILFIVMGLVSLRNSKIFAKKAESESTLADTMKEWCLAHLNAEELDAKLFGSEEEGSAYDTSKPDDESGDAEGEEISDEVKYFKRIEEIKRLLSDKFINLDEGFLEDFVDHIYEEIFED